MFSSRNIQTFTDYAACSRARLRSVFSTISDVAGSFRSASLRLLLPIYFGRSPLWTSPVLTTGDPGSQLVGADRIQGPNLERATELI